MDITFADLQKMPLTKLKEYALGLGGIAGVHGMKKTKLLEAVCAAKGIVDPTKELIEKKRQQAHEDIISLKKQAKEIKGERKGKQKDLNRKEKTEYRLKVKQLKRQTRKLSKI